MQFVNVSAYRFVRLDPDSLGAMRVQLKEKALSCDLKGTILLSPEGINLFLAGIRENLTEFQNFLSQWDEFAGLWYKESESDHQPFNRMLVRLKKEIIAFGKAEIRPESFTAPSLPPQQLKKWFDEGKDMIILDTRNDYEVELGAFDTAVDLKLGHFRNFPEAIANLPPEYRDKPVVTYCTGGIRCEKAAAWMLQQGFKEVYQLEGGILNYFEQCGGNHYHGECFVFDKRVAVDPQLRETQTQQCYGCRAVVQGKPAQCPECGQQGLIG